MYSGVKLTQRAMVSGLLVMTLVIQVSTSAFGDNTPEIPKSIRVITGEQLKVWFDRNRQYLLVDSRIAQEFKTSHIPRAIHVYDKEMDENKARFPADKDFPIVFYCNGYPNCVRSLNGAKKAVSWGFRNVYLYAAGIPDWEARGFPLEKH